MDSSTRIPRSVVPDLRETIYHMGPLPEFGAKVLSLFLCVRPTLTHLRHNPTQELLAELYDVSQATTSRVVAHTPLVAHPMETAVPKVGDLDPNAQLIVDGTLLGCWSWKDHPELYSGKHRTTGVNVQVARTLSGSLVRVSDSLPGSVHDATAIRTSGLLDVPAADLPEGASPPRHVGDKGYIGLDMIIPKRKPPHLPLHPDDRTYNKTINQIRYKIERVIANIKTWRVLRTGYRRPPATFPTTITAFLGIIFTYTP